MQCAAQAGWRAELKLGFRAGPGGRTQLVERARSGPLSVQRALYPEGGVCHTYVLHPPGGVVGGDELDIGCTVGARAHALITTPGATKFYRSQGRTASQQQRLTLGSGAVLEWLPQENIYFPGARVSMKTVIRMAADARLAYWESHCLGRPAIGEGFDSGRLDAGLEIWRDGSPLLLERMRLRGGEAARLSVLGGAPVSATLVLSHTDPSGLDAARQRIAHGARGLAGATLLDDMLVVRYLGPSTAAARRLFVGLWTDLRENSIGRAPHLPRIWAT